MSYILFRFAKNAKLYKIPDLRIRGSVVVNDRQRPLTPLHVRVRSIAFLAVLLALASLLLSIDGSSAAKVLVRFEYRLCRALQQPHLRCSRMGVFETSLPSGCSAAEPRFLAVLLVPKARPTARRRLSECTACSLPACSVPSTSLRCPAMGREALVQRVELASI